MNDRSELTQDEGRVHLFGGLWVEAAGRRVALPGGKAASLLAFLALNQGKIHTREQLIELLWPDSEPAAGRRRLSAILYRLNQALGPGWIQTEGPQVHFAPASEIWVDAATFESLAASQIMDDLQAAADLQQADLLTDLYDDWVLHPRLALRESLRQILLRLADYEESQRRWSEAADFYRRATDLEPLDEPAAQGLMRSLVESGRLAAALQVYQALEVRLRSELDVAPSSETQALGDHLRAEQQFQSTRQAPTTPPPLVGRSDERRRLLEVLDHVSPRRGRIVLLLGEAGMGKTRLMSEVARAARWRGFRVGRGAADELKPRARQPLVQALDQTLPEPRMQQLSQIVRPVWLNTLTELLTSASSAMPDPLVLAETPSSERIALAIQHVLLGLGRVGPHLLLLDDLQWADEALWSLLDRLRIALRRVPVTLILSSRKSDLQARPQVWKLVQDWDRSGEIVLPLPELPISDLRDLIASLSEHQLDGAQVDSLARACQGNPLIAQHLARSGDSEIQLHDKPQLAGLARDQLAGLSPVELAALQAATVIGLRFDYLTWERVFTAAGSEPAELPSLAGSLERQDFLVLEPHGYRFTHETLRASVYAQMPGRSRQTWHRAAFETRHQLSPDDVHDLFYHAQQASLQTEIAAYGLRAGWHLLASGSYAEAAERFSQALEALPADDIAARCTGLLGRPQANHILAERDAQWQDLSQLESIAPPDRLIAAIYWRAQLHWSSGALDEAETSGRQGLALARAQPQPEMETNFLQLLGQVQRNRGNLHAANERILAARDLYRAQESARGEAVTTDLLGGLAWQTGDYAAAAEQHAQAAELFRAQDDPLSEVMSLNNLGSAYWGLGAYSRARSALRQALAVNQEIGHARGEADNLDNLGGVAWVLGDYPAAIDQYNLALAIRERIEDQWGVSISLGNLGSAFRLMGDWEVALDFYAQALAINQANGRRSGQGYNLHGMGLAHLGAGRFDAAAESLEAARELRLELGENTNRIETEAGLVRVYLEWGQSRQARELMKAVLDAQALARAGAALRQWIHATAFQSKLADGSPAPARSHLELAAQAMHEIADKLEYDERRRFLENVPLNQEVLQAAEAHTERVQVRLVRAGVPLGRRLEPQDYTEIHWTLTAPGDGRFRSAQRRRMVLKRLLGEAATQAAAPTDRDLADVLGVSRRTLIRDMANLAEAGVDVATRGRGRPA